MSQCKHKKYNQNQTYKLVRAHTLLIVTVTVAEPVACALVAVSLKAYAEKAVSLELSMKREAVEAVVPATKPLVMIDGSVKQDHSKVDPG